MIRIAVITLAMLVTLGSAPAGQNPTQPVAEAPEVHHAVGLMDEEVAWVRLRKLGFQLQELVLIGDNWEATVVKNGITKHIRVNAVSGTLQEVAQPRPR
jgi:hypothetical protein